MNTVQTQDTVFFDPQQALACARLRQRVPGWGHVDGCQACYYVADEPLPEQLDNLIHLPQARMLEVLVAMRTRMPTTLVFPAYMPAAMQADLTRVFTTIIHEAQRRRGQLASSLAERIAATPHDPPAAGRALRVLAVANRHTTVMQYASRGVIEAFKALGHDARLIIEENECESLDASIKLAAAADFDPDIVFNINHHLPALCRPGAVQVVWWQDPMPPLQAHEQIAWRREDLIYSLDGHFRDLLVACGLPESRMRIQHFCVDTAIFHPPPAEAPRRRAVVFVGSSYNSHLGAGEASIMELVGRIDAAVEAGEILNEARIHALADEHGVPYWRAVCLMTFCIRDRFLRALCRSGAMPVEVYGYGWEKDPDVAPFFRGPIVNGQPVAELYRSVSHVLCLQPYLINHERMGQVGACGCIPVVWDCRRWAEAPYWNEESVYFGNIAELLQVVGRDIPTHPQRFMDHFSYLNFAKRIIDDAVGEGLIAQAP